jgi:hypothetical protein
MDVSITSPGESVMDCSFADRARSPQSSFLTARVNAGTDKLAKIAKTSIRCALAGRRDHIRLAARPKASTRLVCQTAAHNIDSFQSVLSAIA